MKVSSIFFIIFIPASCSMTNFNSMWPQKALQNISRAVAAIEQEISFISFEADVEFSNWISKSWKSQEIPHRRRFFDRNSLSVIKEAFNVNSSGILVFGNFEALQFFNKKVYLNR